MDFRFNEKQEMLRATARDFLSRECRLSLVRDMDADQTKTPYDLWDRIAGLGWLGLVIPEEYSGEGGTFLDFIVVLEEAGRALLPVPLVSGIVLGALPILWSSSSGLKSILLPHIVSGKEVISMAGMSSDLSNIGEKNRLHRLSSGNLVASGTYDLVPDAMSSTKILFPIYLDNSKEKVCLILVDTNAKGVTRIPQKLVSGDRRCRVVLEDVEIRSDSVVAFGDELVSVIEKAYFHWIVAECAWIVGAARRVFEMAVDYVKTRSQYGRRLGSFQSVQHQCAEIAIDIHSTEYVVHRAAWGLGQELDSRNEVAVAGIWAGEACRRVAARSCYLHGALGYSQEYDVQLYLRHIAGASAAIGNTGDFYRRISTVLLD
jgi:alkylation response protein AidB-like acyl-CoA dehydrogenase